MSSFFYTFVSSKGDKETTSVSLMYVLASDRFLAATPYEAVLLLLDTFRSKDIKDQDNRHCIKQNQISQKPTRPCHEITASSFPHHDCKKDYSYEYEKFFYNLAYCALEYGGIRPACV